MGILLNLSLWHLPFVCLIIIGLAQEKYSRIQYRSYEDTIPDQIMQQQHPILYWITEHSTLLSWLNLLLVFLLVGFLYTKLARSWRGKAEE